MLIHLVVSSGDFFRSSLLLILTEMSKMASRHLMVGSKSEFFCPICHAAEECEIHCVETWRVGHRPDHLVQALEGHADAEKMREALFTKYSAIENCFEGTFLVTWQDESPPSFFPLFSGEMLTASNETQQWVSLFHQEGSKLVQRYQELILGQVNKPQQIQRILQAIRQHETLRPIEPFNDSPNVFLFSSKSYLEAASSKSVRRLSPITTSPDISSLSDAVDTDQLLEEVMQNLV